MTLSIGDKVRKYTRDGAGPVENEVHVLFEVIGIGHMQERDADGVFVSTQVAKLKVIE